VPFCGYNTIMKRERIEFTILRYLGRPPSLFDDDAIVAVREIISAAGDNFNWDTFTEYATFHKLSQTLYPNMLTYGRASCPPPKKIPDKKNTTVGAYLCVCPIPDVIIRKFRGIFLANAARNEFLAQELVKINRLLEETSTGKARPSQSKPTATSPSANSKTSTHSSNTKILRKPKTFFYPTA